MHARSDIHPWQPTTELVEHANVSRLRRRAGLPDHRSLLQWSREEIASFWETVIADLEIEFAHRPSVILDVSDGIAWPRWFVDGRINLGHNCVARHAAGTPGRTAVLAESERGDVRAVTYAELHELVGSAARGLHDLGIRQGDRVGLYLPLGVDAVVGLYACAYLGAVAVPMFSGFSAKALRERLSRAGCRALLTAAAGSRRGRQVPMVGPAIEAVAGVKVEVVVRADGAELPAGVHPWESVLEQRPPLPPAELAAEAPFMVAYTSGTTGPPKGAIHVQGGFLVKVGSEVAYHLDVRAEDVLQWTTDMGWILGPWHLIGAHLAGGSVLLYAGAADFPGPARLWELYERHRVTVAGVSPTLIRALATRDDRPADSHDLTSLRILGSTGEAWDPESFAWFSERVGAGRCPVINLSGGTEVGACLLGPYPVEAIKPCSVGGPSLGMAVDVYDDRGRPLRGKTGELVCTKPWPAQTRGFLGEPERYLKTYWARWPDTWVHGDWASIDADGAWFLHGRSDDTLNVAGKRLGPAEVEAAAARHAQVEECVAIGMPDDLKGEVVWCVCTTVEEDVEEDELIEDVRALVTDALGKPFTPASVLIVADLPRTRSGKLVRRLVRDRLSGRPTGDLSSVANPEALAALARVAA